MERLISKSLLWKYGLITCDDYNKTLDDMFLNNSDNGMLLGLEICSSDCDTTFDILQRYWKYECKSFSVDRFGKCLLEDLKTVYYSNKFTIETFGSMCCSLYQQLPTDFNSEEPFHTLSYADDCLSWGDEAQTRRLYEELFDFYN